MIDRNDVPDTEVPLPGTPLRESGERVCADMAVFRHSRKSDERATDHRSSLTAVSDQLSRPDSNGKRKYPPAVLAS